MKHQAAARRIAASVLICLALTACDSIDPTEQTFGITFRNDIGRDVHLKLCSNGRCSGFYYSHFWKTGQSAEENISDRAILTRWLVSDDATGRVLGCLPLEFDQKYKHVLVRISQAVRCPGTHPLRVVKGEGLGRS